MRSTLTAALTVFTFAATTSSALAQPGTCSVTFVRAPDDIRHVIEKFLEAEPHCVSSIELRVLPTDEGLFLIAQRPNGRIHERLVPDAEAAAIIVASWVADDWTAEPPRPVAPPAAAPAIVVSPVAVAREAVVVRAVRADDSNDHWLALGPMTRAADGGGRGLRAELELVQVGAFTGGIAASASTTHMGVQGQGGLGDMETQDYQLMGTLARPFRGDRWSLRPSIGLGAMHTSMNGIVVEDLMGTWVNVEGSTESFVAEASLLVSRRFGDRWSLSAGPIATWIDQTFHATTDNGPSVRRATLDVMLYAGIGYRL